MRILVTGAAGFIGYHFSLALSNRGEHRRCLDNLNDYYDVQLKDARLESLEQWPSFSYFKVNLQDGMKIPNLFAKYEFEIAIYLAVQAGVRYSLENSAAYMGKSAVQEFYPMPLAMLSLPMLTSKI
jgi:UDP-glucuronate 4-epimerase